MNLGKAAEKSIELLKVKPNENVLIITDPEKEKIGNALFNAARKISKNVLLLKTLPLERNGQEPPKQVAELMKKSDVVFCPTKYSLTHTNARKNACKKGARIATLPGITEEMFCRTMDTDYDEIKNLNKKIAELLSKTEKVKISTPAGTDLHFTVKSCKVKQDDGDYSKPGDYGNLPAGEVFLAPKKSTGIIVIDCMAECKPKTKVCVKKNIIQEVFFDKEFKEKLWKYKNARNIAEFGIGTNPKAVVSENTLEDEKVLGTCHIAFGSNFTFGGRVKSEIHWDAILLKPTIYFDNKKIMDSGELLI